MPRYFVASTAEARCRGQADATGHDKRPCTPTVESTLHTVPLPLRHATLKRTLPKAPSARLRPHPDPESPHLAVPLGNPPWEAAGSPGCRRRAVAPRGAAQWAARPEERKVRPLPARLPCAPLAYCHVIIVQTLVAEGSGPCMPGAYPGRLWHCHVLQGLGPPGFAQL